MRTIEEKRAYAKGYAAGRNNAWPKHRPALPPSEVVRPMYEAARKLRDAADNICAQLEEDDVFVEALGPGVDAVDAASQALSGWLGEVESEDESKSAAQTANDPSSAVGASITLDDLMAMSPEDKAIMRDILTKMSRREEKEAKESASSQSEKLTDCGRERVRETPKTP